MAATRRSPHQRTADAWSPCPHPAGSPAKISTLRRRVSARAPLFHPDDNQAIAGPIRCEIASDALLETMRIYAPINTDALGPCGDRSATA